MTRSRVSGWSVVLGIALGGFFDGILLHQILQWHHLLSLVENGGDLRFQVLWDGYFHALMYVIAALGLVGLWWGRAGTAAPDGRRVGGSLLVGFGLWHVADAVLSHWLLGIHRVKIDSDMPLLWDLAWLGLFGILPLVAGLITGRAGRAGPGMGSPALAAIAIVITGAAAWSLQPAPGQPFTTVVFPAGRDPALTMAALGRAEAEVVWADDDMGVVVVALPDDRRWGLYRDGALLVGGAAVPPGCFGWIKA